jgi:hypothetical protein
MSAERVYRAGESVEDFCRACKTDRMHTVVAADSLGRPIRVSCGFCRSEHNYRGGPRVEPSGPAASATSSPAGSAMPMRSSAHAPGAAGFGPPSSHRDTPRPVAARAPFPLVADRERIAPPMSVPTSTGSLADTHDLELLLRRIIREEAGISVVTPAEKWRGGTLVLKPGTPGLQEKTWPIETFFHKVVMLRNRLRTLEQQVNASDLPDDVKVKLQGYVSGCYGSLTSFNILFADEDDQFKGSGD